MATGADLRRWIEQHRVAARREIEERSPLAAGAAFARGLGLIELAARIHGWPLPERPGGRDQDDAAYARWAKLRRAGRRG